MKGDDLQFNYTLSPRPAIVPGSAGSVSVHVNGRKVPRIARRVNPRRGTVVISPVWMYFLRRLPPKPLDLGL